MRKTNYRWLLDTVSALDDDPFKQWQDFECLLWPFAKDGRGYGKVFLSGLFLSAHREAWIIANGIVGGLHVLHRCDVRACFRPVHLFLGTNADNMKDCSLKGRMHCGEKNGSAKLKNDDVLRIRERVNAGEVQSLIASDFGIHRTSISRIASGALWRTQKRDDAKNAADDSAIA